MGNRKISKIQNNQKISEKVEPSRNEIISANYAEIERIVMARKAIEKKLKSINKPKKKSKYGKNILDSRREATADFGEMLDRLPVEDRLTVIKESIRLLSFQLSQSDDELVVEFSDMLDPIGNDIEDFTERLEFNEHGWLK